MKKLFFVILALVLVIGFFVPVKTVGAEENETASWTLLFYLDGNNNLAEDTIVQLNMLEYALSEHPSNDVKIIALLATHSDNAKVFEVLPDNNLLTINSKVISKLGKVNMGDPKTLDSFLVSSIRYYPSKHYALFLFDHGGGIKGLCYDDASLIKNGKKSEFDRLTLPEFKQALQEAKEKTGTTFDIIDFGSCCNMALWEVAYTIQDYAKYMIASQLLEEGDYNDIRFVLQKLLNNPDIAAEEFGKLLVQEYTNTRYGDLKFYTSQGLIDLTKLPLITSSLCQISQYFLTALEKEKKNPSEQSSIYVLNVLRGIRKNIVRVNDGKYVQLKDYPGTDIDLYDFAEWLEKASVVSPEFAEIANGLKKSLNSTIISNRSLCNFFDFALVGSITINPDGNLAIPSSGLSVTFFVEKDEWKYIEALDLPKDWVDFLRACNSLETTSKWEQWQKKISEWCNYCLQYLEYWLWPWFLSLIYYWWPALLIFLGTIATTVGLDFGIRRLRRYILTKKKRKAALKKEKEMLEKEYAESHLPI